MMRPFIGSSVTVDFKGRTSCTTPVGSHARDHRPRLTSTLFLRRSAILTVSMWLLAVVFAAMPSRAEDPKPTAAKKTEAALRREFSKKVYPLLTDSAKGCVECHDSEGTSPLVLSGDAREDFHVLLDEQYLKLKGADTLLNRITTDHTERRMPKDGPSWSAAEVGRLKRFLQSVKKLEDESGRAADEQYPRSLTSPYRGKAITTTDNQFLTYRQLKGKVAVLFEDDWVRDGRDYFAENVSMFGGADFKTRFDETSQPSASFLSALETMSRDVGARAYDEQLGPFKNWKKPPAPPSGAQADAHYRAAINALYEHVLYRPATESEIDEAYRLIRSVFDLESTIAQRDDQLKFELTVNDPQTGLSTKRQIQIPVRGDSLEILQTLVDQASTDQAKRDKKSRLQRQTIAERVHLEPGVQEQRLLLHNLATARNVSFARVELVDPDSDELVRTIDIADPAVEVEGAWQQSTDDGLESYEDRNVNKGQSSIRVNLNVEEAADYRVVLCWRRNERNATHVLVELFARSAGNVLALEPNPEVPPQGQARFVYDSSDDTVAFFAPPATFRFDKEGSVKISNEDTIDQVTAGGVEFTPSKDEGKDFLIDSLDAEGHEQWSRFDEGRFKAYNVKGAKLHDDNRDKGELSLVYRPRDKADAGWQSDQFYNLKIYYPGKRDQECQVPVTITAAQSSPVIQVAHPRLAKADAQVRVDASASYTVQGAPLQFHWRQTGGTRIRIADEHAPVLEFIAPRRSVEQAAWTALCAALMRHPDFLFTRPPSLFQCEQPDVRKRLQLVKLALDLVGRPPTREELKSLAEGRSLEKMADDYLASEEFRQFYFHRIRLYLESQGTEVQDEPVRLWCYVAFHQRPFQEILTADYTVDADMKKTERPAYHGKTGVLTTPGFIQGKPGLPHYNYAAQVSMLFLGYVYEVPPEIVEQREGVTALGTTDPNSVCYSCHKILTPLAFQRLNWSDEGEFLTKDDSGLPIDASDQGASVDYPFAGEGLEAFATQAVKKERFIRTIINTHVNFYFGRPLRHREDERDLYRRLWNHAEATDYRILDLIRAIVTSPEYLDGRAGSHGNAGSS